MVPPGRLAGGSVSAGPISAEQNRCGGRAGRPRWTGHREHAWHGARSRFLAAVPARVEQRLAFSSLQRAERDVRRVPIWEKAETPNANGERGLSVSVLWARRIFLLSWLSSLLGARAAVGLPDQVAVNVPSLLSSLNRSPSRSSEHDLGEDIYDCVPCEDEGDDIYEDIIRVEVQQPMVTIYMRFFKAVPRWEGKGENSIK